MSETVTPESLRALADQFSVPSVSAPALRAAADEIERLQREIESMEHYHD
jgi:hypothetical protein